MFHVEHLLFHVKDTTGMVAVESLNFTQALLWIFLNFWGMGYRGEGGGGYPVVLIREIHELGIEPVFWPKNAE
jgi:hypothetical protein